MQSEIIFITNSTPKSIFPEKFTNNFYLSDVKNIHNYGYTYQSNFSIKFTLEGQETYRINNNAIELRSGQTLIVNQDSETQPGKIEGKGISVFIEPRIIQDIQYSIRQTPLDAFQDDNELPLFGFHDTPHFTTYHLKQTLKKFYCQYWMQEKRFLLEEDFYEIGEALLKDQQKIQLQFNNLKSLNDYHNRKEIFRRLNIAFDYLHSNLHRTPSLQELSQVAHISPFYLSRLFKEVYGMPPIKLLIDLKIKKAKALLYKRTDLKVQDIAYQLGYDTIHAFSKQFKLKVGCSPRVFRGNSE